jgi:hypothetical protein
VVQGEPGRDQGNGDGVHAHVHPAGVLDAVPEVERQADQQAPRSERALATAHGGVVEGGPGVVDNEATNPVGEVGPLTDDLAAVGDEADASQNEDRVAQDFEVEAINGLSESGVGGFEGQQTAPRNVLSGVGHAEHVEDGQEQAPCADEDHGGSVDGNRPVHFLGGLVRTSIVAHGLATDKVHLSTPKEGTPGGSLAQSEVW